MQEIVFGIDNIVLFFFTIFGISIIYVIVQIISHCIWPMGYEVHRGANANADPGQQVHERPARRIGAEHCSICLEAIRSEVQLNCGHIFCAECIDTLWAAKNFARLDCPYCRRGVSLIFENYVQNQVPSQNIHEDIERYNRLYSGRPRSFMERIRDLPTMLRQMFSRFCNMGFYFVIRIVIMLIVLIIYVISPLDLISEAVFGVFGLIDDVIIILGVFYAIGNMFYTAWTRRFGA